MHGGRGVRSPFTTPRVCVGVGTGVLVWCGVVWHAQGSAVDVYNRMDVRRADFIPVSTMYEGLWEEARLNRWIPSLTRVRVCGSLRSTTVGCSARSAGCGGCLVCGRSGRLWTTRVCHVSLRVDCVRICVCENVFFYWATAFVTT